tara:strand:+ start:1689 stop:2495 length:807 start_codon:yes stop_codon:yes gene_type:complete
MRKNNYKIVVLSDLKDDVKSILKSAITLSKMIDGEIKFFHVRSASDVVEKENQLSAMRSINSEFKTIDKKIQQLLAPISKEYDVAINAKFSIGNVKNEIDKYIKEIQPDIIVLGKKKSTSFSFIGDNLTDFILKTHRGVIMISYENTTLEPNKEIALGLLNYEMPLSNLDFSDALIKNSKKPLKSFKIAKGAGLSKDLALSAKEKIVEYVFEKNDNSIKNLSNYVSKNNINLFCINRSGQNYKNKADVKDLIGKINASLLISADENTH